jgi:glycosyltransferase involved in cell wall biosynthesis
MSTSPNHPLSIVICTLNEEKYLPKLLDSIALQQGVTFEVVIADSGSDDDTAGVANRYNVEKNLPVTFISNPIRNISAQRNIGARNAKYEHLLFLDADVVLPDNFLKEAFLDRIIKENILLAGTKIYATEKKWNYRFMYWCYSNLYLPMLRWFKPAMHGCSIFSCKAIHTKVGGFNEGMIFEDYRYGVDALPYYKARLLKGVYVKTSARRFYNATFRSSMELFLAGIYSLFRAGIKGTYMKEYFKTAGNHSAPKY